MARFTSNPLLTVIRTALVVSSVSVMTLGAVSMPQAPSAPSRHATASSTAHVVHADNERWD